MAVYLQKKESAKRIYATAVHSKTNSDGYKDEGVAFLRDFRAMHIAHTHTHTHLLYLAARRLLLQQQHAA